VSFIFLYFIYFIVNKGVPELANQSSTLSISSASFSTFALGAIPVFLSCDVGKSNSPSKWKIRTHTYLPTMPKRAILAPTLSRDARRDIVTPCSLRPLLAENLLLCSLSPFPPFCHSRLFTLSTKIKSEASCGPTRGLQLSLVGGLGLKEFKLGDQAEVVRRPHSLGM
jgi:hypothetical protein